MYFNLLEVGIIVGITYYVAKRKKPTKLEKKLKKAWDEFLKDEDESVSTEETKTAS